MNANVKEYLRRNKLHATAVGAEAAVKAALNRVSKWKHPPLWLAKLLIEAEHKGMKACSAVAEWRDQMAPRS